MLIKKELEVGEKDEEIVVGKEIVLNLEFIKNSAVNE